MVLAPVLVTVAEALRITPANIEVISIMRNTRPDHPELTTSACDPVFLVLHRLDFDELGDPVFIPVGTVRR